MLKLSLLASLFLLLAAVELSPVAAAGSSSSNDDQPGGGEPQFPSLFDPFANEWRVKIVSEIIDDTLGYQTSEELVDLRLGRAAISFAGSGGLRQVAPSGPAVKETLLCDQRLGRIFKYRPYTCKSYNWTTDTVFEQAGSNNLNNWSFEVAAAPGGRSSYSGLLDDHFLEDQDDHDQDRTNRTGKTLRLFGVAGLWMMAQQVAKVYSRSNLIFSTSRDIYRESHNWSFEDRAHDLLVTMHFMDANVDISAAGQPAATASHLQELSLEMVQFSPLKRAEGESSKILRTINVLSVDRLVVDDGDDDQTNRHRGQLHLDLPLGYGCLSEANEQLHDLHDLIDSQDDYVAFALDGTLIELELTQTKTMAIARREQQAAAAPLLAVSRTLQLVLAQSAMFGPQKPVELLQVSGAGARQQLRTVYDYEFNTKYAIDLERGQCTMSHIAWNNMRQDRLIMFSSGGQLDNDNDNKSGGISLERAELELLFVATSGFKFVKRTMSAKKQVVHLYFERELERWPFLVTDDSGQSRSLHDTPARIVRNFAVFAHEVRLDSVTVWLFDRQRDQLVESYHFNVIEEHKLETISDVLGVFDISQECYLQNDQMRAGLDYAWAELFYPASSRLIDVLASKELYYKDFIRSQLLSSKLIPLNALRLPRIELMFDDDGVVVRLLLLDRPSLDLVYTQYDDTRIKTWPDGAADNSTGRQIVGLISPDLRHCVDFCELHACTMMSYCPLISSGSSATNCLLMNSDRPLDLTSGPTAAAAGSSSSSASLCERSDGCTTLVRPQDVPQKKLHDQHLRFILSKLQHQDYDSLAIPSAPDDLLIPQAESNLDAAAYQQTKAAYLAELERFLANDAHRAPELSFVVMHQSHLIVMLPTRFKLDDDPLDKFRLAEREAGTTLGGGLASAYDQQDDVVQSYFERGLPLSRYNLMGFPRELAQQSRRFTNLNYDRCALACVDNRCGSFSYCTNTNECIITSLNSTSMAGGGGGVSGGGLTNGATNQLEATAMASSNLVKQDNECFISYRNFLKSYQRFANVLRPQLYRELARDRGSPSDCALECISQADFNCLSFEACLEATTSATTATRRSYTCYYQAERHPADIRLAAGGPSSAAAGGGPTTNCDHYERSLLADFNQIAYRQLEPRQLARLESAVYEARSVYECADICVGQLADCSAFQFCLNPPGGGGGEDSPLQVCTMIQGKLGQNGTDAKSEPEDNYNNDNDDDDSQARIIIADSSLGGQPQAAGKAQLIASDHCHLFALRQDTGEAHVRELTLGNAMTLEQAKRLDGSRQANPGNLGGGGGGSLSLAGGLALFATLAIVSAAAGFGLCLANERSELVRQRLARLRLLLPAGAWYR